MSALFSPMKLRGLALANRIMVAPMCQYSADDGAANDWHFTHINTLALSGAAMFCIEATHVEAIGRITPGCLGLWDDATEAALKPILTSVRKHSKTAVASAGITRSSSKSSRNPADNATLRYSAASPGHPAESPTVTRVTSRSIRALISSRLGSVPPVRRHALQVAQLVGRVVAARHPGDSVGQLPASLDAGDADGIAPPLSASVMLTLAPGC